MRAIDYLRMPARVGAAAGISGVLAAALTIEERVRGVPEERREEYVQAWARSLIRALGVEVVREAQAHAEGQAQAQAQAQGQAQAQAQAQGEAQARARARLVVANHRSTVDIFLMLSLFGGHLLARGDMEGWPVVGKMAQMAGTLFVDRSDAGSGAASIRRVTDRLQKGRTIGVFPEGTTFDDDEVRPFHAGAFMAVARVRGVVTPVGIAYEEPRAHYRDEPIGDHFRRILVSDRTRVGVAIGEPIDSVGLPIAKLRDRAHAEVQALVRRARALVDR
jgi:1-acyl-sn-glycerol-3-phosphate acyltransferase